MTTDRSADDECDISRVLQTKSERKAFYDKIASVYDLLAEHSEQPIREMADLRVDAPAFPEPDGLPADLRPQSPGGPGLLD